MRGTGAPMLVLWGGFVGWSSLRLIRGLAQEPEVSENVVDGGPGRLPAGGPDRLPVIQCLGIGCAWQLY
jgi:hypothetical protein